MTTVLLVLLLAQDPVIDRLISDLGSDSVDVREKATTILVDFGEAAEREIRQRLPTLTGESKGRAEEVLRRIAAERERRKYFPPFRRVSIGARDRALGDVAAEIGLPIEGPRELKITLCLADVSPLEAIDALAGAAGHRWVPAPALAPWEWTESHPRFQPVYVLKPGAEPATPRQYVGRYRISLASFTMGSADGSVPKSRPLLGLAFRWPLDAHPDDVKSRITSVTDDQGEDLMERINVRGRDVDFGSVNSIQGMLTSETAGYYLLKAPSPKATRVVVRGKMILRYPNPRQTISFESPENGHGQKRESRGVTVTLTGFEWNGTSGRVSLEAAGSWERKPRPEDEFFVGAVPGALRSLDFLRLRTEDGSFLGLGGGSMSPLGRTRAERKAYSHWEIRKDFTSTKPVKIAAVEAVTVPDWFYDAVEFELKDIPLPR